MIRVDVDSEIRLMGDVLVLHDQGGGHQDLVYQMYFKVSMRCSKSKFTSGIIVFDEHKSITFEIQGLSLLTESLVLSVFEMAKPKSFR